MKWHFTSYNTDNFTPYRWLIYDQQTNQETLPSDRTSTDLANNRWIETDNSYLTSTITYTLQIYDLFMT